MRLTNNAAVTATAIPAAAADTPPVNIPTNPSFLTAFITPSASVPPKPTIGTVMPELANFLIGANRPTAPKKTPIETNRVNIRDGVILVRKIRS